MFSSRKKKHSKAPSTSAPATGSGLVSSQVTQQLHFPTNSQSQSHPVSPWSAHSPPSGQFPSPFLRHGHALSTSATAAGELFLSGGFVHGSKSSINDLYVFSTRDFSTTPLQTSGDVPSPRFAHRAVFTGTTLLIWGGMKNLFSEENAQNQKNDDSFYLLNLGMLDHYHVKTRSS